MKKYIILLLIFSFQFSTFNPLHAQRMKKTKTGLEYRFETRNRKYAQPRIGDVLVGEMTLRFDTVKIFSNEGEPTRIFHVSPCAFRGDINEGLLMMHVGDKAHFAVPADSLAALVGPAQLPPSYQAGTGQKIYYTISLHKIITPEDILREEDSIRQDTERRKAEEGALLSKYIQDNYTDIEYSLSGLYIAVKKRGEGPRIKGGSKVTIEYAGRLLDGTVFDTNSITYYVGQTRLIQGWEEGIHGQPEGTELTLIMPSSLAYGERGAGKVIPPYSPLRFDIKILKVEEL